MKPIKILLFFLLIIGFSQCGSSKFENDPPFLILSAVVYNNPEKLETNIYIRYKGYHNESFIEFDSIFFKKQKVKIDIKTMRGLTYVYGVFKKSIQRNLVLDSNPIKEINNPVPDIKKFPFKLNENEAVLSYIINGKLKYYKIKSLKKEKSISFPSTAKQ